MKAGIFGFFLTLFFLQPFAGHAQRELDLAQCLDLVVANNIQAQISSNNLEGAEVAYLQRKFDFLPGVSANIPINKSFGKSADMFTQQIAESPWTSNPSLVASMTLFKGFSKWSELKNAEYAMLASKYSLDDLKNDLRLNAALAFFQAIFAEENLVLAKERRSLLEKQLEKVKLEQAAGTKTEGDVVAIQAQLATEEVNVVSQQNAYERALLDLVLSMNLSPTDQYKLVPPALPDLGTAELEDDLGEIFANARLNDPGIRNQEFRALSAKYAIKTARSGFMPSLNINYGIGSFYSSNRREVAGYQLGSNGLPEIVYGNRVPVFDQLETFFSQQLSFSLNIPIFSRYVPRQSYLNAKLNYENAILNGRQEAQNLFKSVAQAHQDAKASLAKYKATQVQVENLNASFSYAQARMDAGLLDVYAFIEILNNKTRAETELLQARYDYVLKLKVLDLYQGKPLSF